MFVYLFDAYQKTRNNIPEEYFKNIQPSNTNKYPTDLLFSNQSQQIKKQKSFI